MEIQIHEKQPTVKDFAQLRNKVGWGGTNLQMAQTSLNNSLFHVTAFQNKQLVGMGRVIGDGAMFFYIQDVVVDPEFQQQGLGNLLMNSLESYLAKTARKGATIALLAAQGKEEFYKRYSYIERDGTRLGKGMCKFV